MLRSSRRSSSLETALKLQLASLLTCSPSTASCLRKHMDRKQSSRNITMRCICQSSTSLMASTWIVLRWSACTSWWRLSLSFSTTLQRRTMCFGCSARRIAFSLTRPTDWTSRPLEKVSLLMASMLSLCTSAPHGEDAIRKATSSWSMIPLTSLLNVWSSKTAGG